MPRYQVTSLDLLSGQRIAQISLSNLNYGWSYQNGLVVGYVKGGLVFPSLASTAGRIRAGILNDAVEENKRHLFVDRDGVTVGDGIVWNSPMEGRIRKVEAGSTLTYLDRRIITRDRVFELVDQLEIARTIIGDKLAEPNGNIGITMGTELSGRLRTRSEYLRYHTKNLGEALEQLCQVEDGFDLAVDCSWDPATGAPIKLLRMHYPRRGRGWTQSRLEFVYGQNMTFDWPSKGEGLANRVHGIGDGMEDSMLIYTASDPSSLNEGYPVYEATYSNKSLTQMDTLVEQTEAELRAAVKPRVFPKMKLRADKDPRFGAYIIGDTCKIRVPPGRYERFPDGMETYRRITGIDVDVDDEGNEDIYVTTVEEPGA